MNKYDIWMDGESVVVSIQVFPLARIRVTFLDHRFNEGRIKLIDFEHDRGKIRTFVVFLNRRRKVRRIDRLTIF